MPNIEIHGFEPKEATILRRKIFRAFIGNRHIKDMVVTIYLTDVRDARGLKQPFLRLCTTSLPDIDEVIEILKSLKIDLEYVSITSFFPKGA
jgi:hypothetical protein